jgi:tetratricopeptide (TPR) repeat protein
MGTPNYMSPEQIRGQKVDARSDVFSLGAVFYELLSQHRPFEADSAHDVRFQIAEREPEPLRKWAPEAPPALVAVVEQALAKDPAARFADARELGRALATARDAIEGDTIARPAASDADRTLLQGGDATVVQPSATGSAFGTIRGATALTLARTPAAAGRSHMPRTVRPDPTVAGGPATAAPARAGFSRSLVIGGGAAALAIAVAVGVAWMRSRASAPGAAPAVAGPEQAGIMADVFVTNQVELARADLADRDYASAARRADEALKLNAGSADAREVLEEARRALRQIDDAVTEARADFGKGDLAGASEALGRVMALAPRHPVVAELSAALQQHLRPQAEDSRQQALGARKAAEATRALSSPAFKEGGQLATEADALFRGQDYANAAQKYLESRNAFERAKRDADEARAVAARPSPSARPPVVAANLPGPTVPSPSAAPSSTPVPAPMVAAVPTAPPTAAPLPSPSASLPPAPRAEGADAAVRRVIEEYGRAISSQDVALFRSLKPDLSADDEKRLREAFGAIKSQDVGITVESIQIDGDRATVRVTRQDVVNGRSMKPAPQTFRLARSGGSWLIQSIGQ